MNSLKIIAGGMVVLAIVGGAAACSSQPSSVDVVQEGGYDSMHIYHIWPQSQWHVVHVNYNVYHTNTRLYSTPSYEKTYVKTHTTTHTTTTNSVNRSVSTPKVSLNKNSVSKTVTHQRSTMVTTRRK
jgi:L-serine deaminase